MAFGSKRPVQPQPQAPKERSQWSGFLPSLVNGSVDALLKYALGSQARDQEQKGQQDLLKAQFAGREQEQIGREERAAAAQQVEAQRAIMSGAAERVNDPATAAQFAAGSYQPELRQAAPMVGPLEPGLQEGQPGARPMITPPRATEAEGHREWQERLSPEDQAKLAPRNQTRDYLALEEQRHKNKTTQARQKFLQRLDVKTLEFYYKDSLKSRDLDLQRAVKEEMLNRGLNVAVGLAPRADLTGAGEGAPPEETISKAFGTTRRGKFGPGAGKGRRAFGTPAPGKKIPQPQAAIPDEFSKQALTAMYKKKGMAPGKIKANIPIVQQKVREILSKNPGMSAPEIYKMLTQGR